MSRATPSARTARRIPGSRASGHPRWLALLALSVLLPVSLPALPAANALGLPFTRSYSFEEIGNVARGARLGFDDLGRIAVMSAGSYSVLNDTTWIDLTDKEIDGPTMQSIFYGPDGDAYYGSFGSWGRVETTARGLLRPHSLLPADYPKWALSANFTEVVVKPAGVYFGGFSGIVYWDKATGRQDFFQATEATHIFAVGDQVYVSSHSAGIQRIDLQTRSLQPTVSFDTDAVWVDQVTPLSPDLMLLSLIDGRLLLFNGRALRPWPGPLGDRVAGRVTALCGLSDGGAAIAINGRGLYLVSAHGEILSAYTTPEYHRITSLAANEAGVLWVVTESGIEKMLYQSPLTVFGQRLGLPISWAQVARWKDRIVVASGGRLYETDANAPTTVEDFQETNLFHLVSGQPQEEVWGISAQGDQLLIGSSVGVLAREADGTFSRVLDDINATRLVMVSDELCYVIGIREITALRRSGGRWAECTPRVAGLGFPSIVHAAGQSAWIELGADRVARISLRDDRVRVNVFEHFPWKDPKWVNIGVVGDIVVLSGMPDGRVFFDERTGDFVEAPGLRRVFEQAPYDITRVRQDEFGTLWAVHDHGLLTFDPVGDGYRMSPANYGRINERFPNLQLLPGGDVWLTTGQSLYHVDRRFATPGTPPASPKLVSMMDGRTSRDLLGGKRSTNSLPLLAYAENSLVLRFFAGGYASRQSPDYDFRLHRGGNSWTTVGNGSLLTLTGLQEGAYRLEVRIRDAREVAGMPLLIDFAIAPPWYRTWLAYLLYTLGGVAAIYGLMRWSVQRARSRYMVLEKLVAERTDELRIAMQQLNEETRNAATVAERDRLAGEIHDSLQQGLSGLMLHLDATLKLPELSDDVRARLSVARNMVSFTRHEVQHAVWDMETPLLEGTELGDALRKITALIGPGETHVDIIVSGEPIELSSSTKHHLLRIAQEAITNAVRHSAARTIAIALNYEPAQVSLSISDDGNGFVPDDVLVKGLGHFGLRGLRGRAGKIGGDLQIESAPGRGTVVRVRVPVLTSPFAHASQP